MTSSDDVKWSKKIKDCFPAFAKNRSNLGPWILDLGSALLHAYIRTGIGTSRGCHMSAEGTGPAGGRAVSSAAVTSSQELKCRALCPRWMKLMHLLLLCYSGEDYCYVQGCSSIAGVAP